MKVNRRPSIGKLDRVVTVRKRSDFPTDDDQGLGSTFTEEFKRWAMIRAMGGSIYQLSVQTGTNITHRITLRYLPKLDTSYEIVHGKTVYRIHRQYNLEDADRYTVAEVEELNHVPENSSNYPYS